MATQTILTNFIQGLSSDFQKGLEDFIRALQLGQQTNTVIQGGLSPTSTLYMCAITANPFVSWTVPANQTVVNVVPLSGSTNWLLSTSGLKYNDVHGVAGAQTTGIVAMYNASGSGFIQNTKLSQGEKLYLSNQSASVADVLVFMTVN